MNIFSFWPHRRRNSYYGTNSCPIVSRPVLFSVTALLVCLVLGVLVPDLLRAQSLTIDRLREPGWWPTKSVNSRRDYVGPRKCAQCHTTLADTQQKTAMGRSLARGADSRIIRTLAPLSYRQGPHSYRIVLRGKECLFLLKDGNRTISTPVLWAFGYGMHGQTYLLKWHGTYYESQLSFFTALQGLDVTPGHTRFVPTSIEDALGRIVDPGEAHRCFGCHSTAAIIHNRVETTGLIPGVTCEACHGPGAKHVSHMMAGNLQKTFIFNPAKLKPGNLVDFCGACHRTAMDVDAEGVLGIHNLRFQPYRLEKSRCWNPDDARIACTGCHDPHVPLQHNLASYDSKCLACHLASPNEKRDAKHPGLACPVSTRNCVTCHMPKYEVPGWHTKFTDHYIRVVKAGEPYPN